MSIELLELLSGGGGSGPVGKVQTYFWVCPFCFGRVAIRDWRAVVFLGTSPIVLFSMWGTYLSSYDWRGKMKLIDWDVDSELASGIENYWRICPFCVNGIVKFNVVYFGVITSSVCPYCDREVYLEVIDPYYSRVF